MPENGTGSENTKAGVSRTACLWAGALGMVLLVCFLAWYYVWPLFTARRVLADIRAEELSAAKAVYELGGRRPAARCLALYLRLPESVADHRKEAVAVLARCGSPAVGALGRALAEPDAATRRCAATGLKDLGAAAEPAVEQLTAVLSDADGGVRSAAAGALAAVGPPARGALPRLVAMLEDADASVRKAAREAIECIGPGAAPAAALIGIAKRKGSAGRLAAIDILGQVRPVSPDAARTLVRALASKDHKVSNRARSAILGTGAAGVAAFGEELRAPDPKVRARTAEALASLTAYRPARPRARALLAGAVPALIRNLDDADEKARCMAIRALGACGPDARKAVPRLTELLGSWDLSVECAAVKALGRIGPDAKAAVGALARKVGPEIARKRSHPTTGLRSSAAEALGRIGPAAIAALPELEGVLGDKRLSVRIAAAKAVWQISGGAEKSLPVLRSLVTNRGRAGRYSAIAVLGEMGTAAKPAYGDLLKLFEGLNPGNPKDLSLMSQVLVALARIDPKADKTAGILQKACKSKSWQMRMGAAKALEATGGAVRGGKDLLLELLDDKAVYIAVGAARGLGKLGPLAAEAVPRMVEMLDVEMPEAGTNWFYQVMIIEALGRIGPAARSAAPALARALADRDYRIRSAAAEALGAMGPAVREVIPDLESALKDTDESVRKAAAGALRKIRG